MRDILRYLIEHPEAKDTVDGIIRWWFPQVEDEIQAEEIRAALDQLVAQGWLIRRQTTPAQFIYGLSKADLETILAFLKEPEP